MDPRTRLLVSHRVRCLAYLCEHANAKKCCLFLFTVTSRHDLRFGSAPQLEPPRLEFNLEFMRRGRSSEGEGIGEETFELDIPAPYLPT